MLKKILLLLVSLSMPYVIAMDPTSPTHLHQDSGGQGLPATSTDNAVARRRDSNHAIAPEEQRRMEQDVKRTKLDENPLGEPFELLEPWQVDLDINEPLPFAQNEEECLTITTQDGKDFKVPVRLAKLSETIKNLIEDAGIDNPIPMPTVNTKTWYLIQSLLGWVSIIRLNGAHAQQVKDDTICVLRELKGAELLDFIMAVNYLDIAPLLPMIIDIVKQSNVQVLSPAQIAQLPKEIRNPIILTHITNVLAPLQEQQLHVIAGHKRSIDKLCVSPDGSKVFSVHSNGMIRCWDIQTGNKLSQFGQVTWGNSVTLCLLPDDTKAIVGFWGKPMRTWDLATNQETFESIQLERPDDLYIRLMQVTPDGTKIVGSLLDSTIVWDIKTGKILTHYQNKERFCSFCITPDSSKIVTCSQLGTIMIHDSTTGEKLDEFPRYGQFTDSIMVTPDGTKIVLNCADKVITMRDLKDGTVLGKFVFDTMIRSVCVTPDGSMLVLGLMDGAITVCDIHTSKEIMRFEGHKAAVTSLRVTGTRLISASEDNTLRIWNLALFNPLLAITAGQAYHIWDCLQKNDLVQCREYVQTIIAQGNARKPSPKRHKAGE